MKSLLCFLVALLFVSSLAQQQQPPQNKQPQAAADAPTKAPTPSPTSPPPPSPAPSKPAAAPTAAPTAAPKPQNPPPTQQQQQKQRDPSAPSNVRVLTDSNFEHDTQLTTGGTTGDWLIEFYAPWCGHCKRLAPIWEQVADRLNGKINVAKVNVDENPSVASRFNIRSLPTIRFFRAGKSYSFEGDRSVDELVRFATDGYSSKAGEPIPAGPNFLENLELQLVPLLQNLENHIQAFYQQTVLPVYHQHVEPAYDQHVAPFLQNNVMPVYNEHVEPFYRTKVQPVYDEHIHPIYRDHVAPFWHQKVVPIYHQQVVPFYQQQAVPFWNQKVVPFWRQQVVPRAGPALDKATLLFRNYAVWYAGLLKRTGWFDGIVDPVSLEKDLDHIFQFRKFAVGLLVAWSFSAGLLFALFWSRCCGRRHSHRHSCTHHRHDEKNSSSSSSSSSSSRKVEIPEVKQATIQVPTHPSGTSPRATNVPTPTVAKQLPDKKKENKRPKK